MRVLSFCSSSKGRKLLEQRELASTLSTTTVMALIASTGVNKYGFYRTYYNWDATTWACIPQLSLLGKAFHSSVN